MTTHKSNKLVETWSVIYKHSTDAIQWVDKVRSSSKRLDNEADNIKLELYRSKNLANNLRRVAATPMTVGFFGISQAGKSYLISALAADSAGQLITDFGGDKLNFLHHINPTGIGLESTGLVTRFSRLAKASPDSAFPVELRLFREIEVAMVLANSWFNDFDQELIDYTINKELIKEHLSSFNHIEINSSTPTDTGAICAEDVVALMDNVGEKRSVSELKHTYWSEAIRLIPHLSIQQRGDFLSILWGKQNEITKVYVQLATALQQLGGAQTIYAPLGVLIEKTDSGFIQKNSIMSVDTLGLLGSAEDKSVQVRPSLNGELGSPVAISRAELTVLVSEMIFRLIAESSNPVVEQVDLLDFPGYRTRLKMPDTKALQTQKDTISQMLLRGKVSYLFESYTNAQEMNGLIMCTNSDRQGDVVDIEQALKEWIAKTQGETPKERSQRQPGLIWAMTKADLYIQNALNTHENQRKQTSDNLINITILKRFGKASWLQDWNGKPFNNTVLVRKPRSPSPFIELDENGDESGIAPYYNEALNDLRDGFITNASIKQHVASAAETWDAMIALNDGGITYLGERIQAIADLDFKLQRIEETRLKTLDALKNNLGSWYHEDADDIDGAQLKKVQIVLSIWPKLPMIGGELIHLLSLNDETVRDILLNGDYTDTDITEPETLITESISAIDDFDFGVTVESAQAPIAVKQSHEQLFAQAVYKSWIAHLRNLALQNSALSRLHIPNAEQVIPILIEELITASARKNLVGMIEDKLRKIAESKSNARLEHTAQIYVLNAQLTIQDFIAYAGYLTEPLDKRPTNKQNRAVFDFPNALDEHNLPKFENEEQDPASIYLLHWLMAFTTLIKENAGHDAGREINVEQNSELGTILRNVGVL